MSLPNFDLTKLTVAELLEHQTDLVQRAQAIKSDVGAFAGELSRRFAENAVASLKAAGKSHGTLTEILPNAGGIRLKSDTKREVEWNQDKLLAWAGDKDWAIVAHFLRVTLEVKEAVFKALPPDDKNLEAFMAARTEKFAPSKFSLVEPKA